jgi:hypothetical protein
MLKYIVVSMLIGISFIHADTIPNLDKLKAEKQALILKLEAYSLKKKIIQMENFITNDKLQKERKIEREKALVRLKNDLRANRGKVKYLGVHPVK